METKTIEVNGRQRKVRAAVVAELLVELGLGGQRNGIAVAINGEVIQRQRWTAQGLHEGDVVELLGAVQGG